MTTSTITYTQTVESPPEPLTENGFTVAEEERLLQAWKDVKSGKVKTISSEEMRLQIEMESRI